MYIDSLVIIYKTMFQIKISWLERYEMGLSPNHVISFANGHQYYVSINFIFL